MSTPTLTIDVLCTMLASADPHERDAVAYSTLAQRVLAGEVDGGLAELGNRVAANLGHPEIQARTFVPLILDLTLARDQATGELDAETVRRWRDAFTAWWSAETDLRGYDRQLGWLHAMAHGADLVGSLATSPHLDAADLTGLLNLVAVRLVTPTDEHFHAFEDDRVACAIACVLARPELDAAASTDWLAVIGDAVDTDSDIPIPAWRSNTVKTLNSLYVAVSRGVNMYTPPGREQKPLVAPHRDEILDAIADVLRRQSAFLA